MQSHDEIAKDVYLVKYSDGSEMVCNYSKEPYKYKGATAKSMDYALIRGE